MAGNRIELDGRLVGPPEVRVTPAGTPVFRLTVECGAPGEELKLGVVMTGDSALAIRALLEPGRPVRVVGRLRVLKAARALKLVTVGREPIATFEVVAESVEPADS